MELQKVAFTYLLVFDVVKLYYAGSIIISGHFIRYDLEHTTTRMFNVLSRLIAYRFSRRPNR